MTLFTPVIHIIIALSFTRVYSRIRCYRLPITLERLFVRDAGCQAAGAAGVQAERRAARRGRPHVVYLFNCQRVLQVFALAHLCPLLMVRGSVHLFCVTVSMVVDIIHIECKLQLDLAIRNR